MASKKVPQMVQGLSMAMRFITLLTQEVEKRGGREEMLHFLTTKYGRENLEKVATLVASLDWLVPMSLVIKLMREKCLSDSRRKHAEDVEHDSSFSLHEVLDDLGIPYLEYRGEKEFREDCAGLITDELRNKLHGVTAEAGILVHWEGELHVVMSIDAVELGKPIDAKELLWVYLSPARYFMRDIPI